MGPGLRRHRRAFVRHSGQGRRDRARPDGDPPFAGTVYFLEMEGLKEELRSGTTVPLVFEFEEAGSIAVPATVLTGEEATLPPLGCRHG